MQMQKPKTDVKANNNEGELKKKKIVEKYKKPPKKIHNQKPKGK